MAIDWELVAFLVLSVIELGASIAVVVSRKLVHAAFWLAVTLVTIAGIYLVMRAEFVALIQILVYAGAVPVLFVFGIMVTRRKIMEEATPAEIPAEAPPASEGFVPVEPTKPEAPPGGGAS